MIKKLIVNILGGLFLLNKQIAIGLLRAIDYVMSGYPSAKAVPQDVWNKDVNVREYFISQENRKKELEATYGN